MSYLTRKAHSAQQDSGLETASAYIAQKSSIPYRPLSWMEWMEMFGYGLVDTAYFVNGLFPVEHETKYMRDIQKIGYCCMIICDAISKVV